MSIPNYSGCYTDVVGCPKLFEDLEAILGVVWNELSSKLGNNPCSNDMQTYVSLPAVAADNCNIVAVFPDGVSVQKGNTISQQYVLRRTRIQAGILVLFDGYPNVDVVDNVPIFPGSGELHLASKFLTSLAWCVMCALLDAMADGTLLGTNDISLDGNILNMELLQPEGTCAGFLITIEVYRD